MKRALGGAWVVAALGLGGWLAGPCLADDVVSVTNPNTTGDIGVLVDGKLGSTGAETNDHAVTGAAGDRVPVGDVRAGTYNEILVFQAGRAVAVGTARWTDGDDVVPVTLATEYGIPLCVWFVGSTTATTFNRTVAGLTLMGSTWRDERLGLRLGTVTFGSTVSDTASKPFTEFKCTKVGCKEADNLRSKVGFTEGMINLYYVDMVDYGDGMSRGNAVWCGDNTIVLGSATSGALLAHEFGHAAALSHVDGLACFDETNVMHSSSDTRRYFTEGQTFRVHFEPSSVISGSPYYLRSGLPTRACGDISSPANWTCPVLEKRIWTDCPSGPVCACEPN